MTVTEGNLVVADNREASCIFLAHCLSLSLHISGKDVGLDHICQSHFKEKLKVAYVNVYTICPISRCLSTLYQAPGQALLYALPLILTRILQEIIICVS